jgi:hypothetical protein
MKRIIVCGGRDYDNQARMHEVLDGLLEEFGDILLIQGGAKGADLLARNWAILKDVDFINVAARWGIEGRSAGPIRNERMLSKYKPQLVVAFPGGRGTISMRVLAENAGVPVRKID